MLPPAASENDGGMQPSQRLDPTLGYAAADVRAAERPLLAAGVPLMARASAALADDVLEVLAARGRRRGRVLVLAGSGGNGGDALYAGALLAAAGCRVAVAPLGRRVLAPALAAARRSGAEVLPPDASTGRVAALGAASDVVLDGLLGIGATGGLRAPTRQTVAALADAAAGGPHVVAVDLPSGVDPDDGRVEGPVLAAGTTVTFGAMKAGLLLAPPALVGRLRLVDLGLGPSLAGARPLATAAAGRPVTVQVRVGR